MIRRAVACGLTCQVFGAILTAWSDPASGHLAHAGVLALTAAYVAWAACSKTAVRFQWPALAIAAPAVIGLAQAVLGGTAYAYVTWGGVATWVARTAAFILAANVLDGRLRQGFQTALVRLGVAMSVVGVLAWFTSGGRIVWVVPTGRAEAVMGTFPNRDHYAAFIELVLPAALWRALTGSRPSPWNMAAAGALFASVVVCGSRAGIAVATLEVLALIGLACLKKQRVLRTIGPVIALIVLCTLIGGSGYAWERFRWSDPFAFRRELLAATAAMIKQRPLSGFGVGTWPTIYPAHAVFDPPGYFMNHAHNDWAEWMAEGGAAATVPLLVLAFAAVRGSIRRPWCAGAAGVLLHSVVDFPMQKPALGLLSMTLLGAAFSNADERETCEDR
jgi:O-antigen ligase